jgi:hypothetical protein
MALANTGSVVLFRPAERGALRAVIEGGAERNKFSDPQSSAANTANVMATAIFNYTEKLLPFLNDEIPASKESKMSDMTREEIDAKLDRVEARAETRFVELSGKIDRLSDLVTSMTMNVSTMTTNIGSQLTEVKSELGVVKSDNKFTRLTIIVAVVASVLAGLGALWVTQANLLASFQTGIALRAETKDAPAPPPPLANNKGTGKGN